MASVFVFALLLCAGLGWARIERLEDRVAGFGASSKQLAWRPHEDSYLTQEQRERLRRQQSSDPQQSGYFEFTDGYRYGLVHYSGDESEVCCTPT